MTTEFKPVLYHIKPTQAAGDVPRTPLDWNWFSNSSFSFEYKTRVDVKEKQRP